MEGDEEVLLIVYSSNGGDKISPVKFCFLRCIERGSNVGVMLWEEKHVLK